MTAANFPACLKIILASEGGFVLDDGTGVGASNFGITQQTLTAWLGRTATADDVRNLTPDVVSAIYKSDFFNLTRCDVLADGLDLMLFDAAVQHGPGTAVRMLQRALSVPVDGLVGPVTIAAAAKANTSAMIAAIVAARDALYRRLALFPKYGSGWLARLHRTAADAYGMVSDQVQPGVTAVPMPPVVDGQPYTVPPVVTVTGTDGTFAIPPAPPPPPPVTLPTIPKAPAVVKQAPAVAATATGVGALTLIGQQALTSVNFSGLVDKDWPILFAGVLAPLAVYAITRALQLMHFNSTPAIQDVVARGVALAGQQVQEYADAHPNVDVHDAKVAAAMQYVVNAVPDKLAQSGISQTQLYNLTQAKIAQLSQGA